MGRVETVTSYNTDDASGWLPANVLNQDQYAYNGWGNETCEWQALTGAVDTGSTPSVQYTYQDGAVGGVASYVRLTDMIYPSGRDVSCGYGNAATLPGMVDEVMSRLATISDSSGTLAAFTYLGAGTVASESYPQPGVSLDYSADDFAALDRFGRVADQSWSQYGQSMPLDGYQYTYDRAGNRTIKENLADAALSETYGYNALNELTSMSRGALSGSTIPAPTDTQTWTLDALGNFMQSSDNAATQYRTADAANEIQSISGGTATPAYDLAGNMTTTPDPQPGAESTGLTCVYDAWNRLVEVSNGSTILAQYQVRRVGASGGKRGNRGRRRSQPDRLLPRQQRADRGGAPRGVARWQFDDHHPGER